MGLPHVHMPSLTRQTTYSSLPPSPRYETYELEKDPRRGFEEALERLTRTRSSGDDPRRNLDGQPRGQGGSEIGQAEIKTPQGSLDRQGNAQEPEQEQSGGGGEGEGEGLSLWDLLRDEVSVEDWDGWIVDGKWERIANFLAVPLAVEKVSPVSWLPDLTWSSHLFLLGTGLG